MDKAIQDVTLGTVGRFAFAAGTVGTWAAPPDVKSLGVSGLPPSASVRLPEFVSNDQASTLQAGRRVIRAWDEGKHRIRWKLVVMIGAQV